MPRLIDISPLVHPGVAVFPGDTPFARRELLRLADGANIDLSTITTTVHVGAHADAPSHYALGAPGIDARPLDLYYGPCEVLRVSLPRGERIRPEHLRAPVRAPRVLFATGSMPDPDVFNEDFNSLSPELIDALAAQGVRLIGIDTPSVDPASDAALPSHAALARNDLAVLEGVVLGHVPEGLYTLIALPLKLAGSDASPVRAALLSAD